MGEYVYQPAVGCILPAGEHVLTVTFYPKRLIYAPVSCTTSIRVLKSRVMLEWRVPESIMEGERLTRTILSCYCTNITSDSNANVVTTAKTTAITTTAAATGVISDEVGTYTYKPPLDTTLEAGRHRLQCTFTPYDTNNYLPGEMTKMLLVRHRPRFAVKLAWQNPVVPTPIVYGTPLNNYAMLTAKVLHPVNCHGEFQYTPGVGVILPVGEHVLTAHFTPEESQKYLSAEITSTITVVPRVPHIHWQPEAQELVYGEGLSDRLHCNAVVTVTSQDKIRVPGEIRYQPSIDTRLPCGDHTVLMTFIPDDKLNYTTVEDKRQFFVTRSIPSIIWPLPKVPLIYPVIFAWCQAIPRPYLRNMIEIQGCFEFRDFAVDEALIVGEHTLSVRFIPDDLINYLGSSASITITVLPGTPKVVWMPETTIIYETPLNSQLHCNARADIPNGQYLYTPPVGTILHPTPGDDSQPVKLTLQYIPDDTVNYTSATLTRFVNIHKKWPVLSWKPPKRFVYGCILDDTVFNATLSKEENTALTLANCATENAIFTYSPPLGTMPHAGRDIQITVTFTPPLTQLDHYHPVTMTHTIEVMKATPEIVWRPKFLSLIEGNAIDERHCNAVIVHKHLFPGQLVYDPPARTILPVGRQHVKLTYLPDYPEDVQSVEMEQHFDISKKAPKIIWEIDPMTGRMKCRKVDESKLAAEGGSGKHGSGKRRSPSPPNNNNSNTT